MGWEHQEEESFVALAYLALVEDAEYAEYAEVHFLWPGQRRNLRAVLNIYYFFVPTEDFKSSAPQRHIWWRSLWGWGVGTYMLA